MQETDYYTPLAHIPPLPRVFLSFFLTRFTSQRASFTCFPSSPSFVGLLPVRACRIFEGIRVLGVIRVCLSRLIMLFLFYSTSYFFIVRFSAGLEENFGTDV